ncbi:MAG: hypothetical protein Q9208_002410 [Pyrenodesmia sp. 3 TL-2023]
MRSSTTPPSTWTKRRLHFSILEARTRERMPLHRGLLHVGCVEIASMGLIGHSTKDVCVKLNDKQRYAFAPVKVTGVGDLVKGGSACKSNKKMHANLFSSLAVLVLSTLQLCVALECYAPPQGSLLPNRNDCRKVINAIIYAANRPHGNDPKEWGRNLPTGGKFEHLPRTYQLQPERNTCAVELDADPSLPLHDFLRETFTLMTAAHAALRVWEQCLGAERRLGMERIGAAKQVVIKITKSDPPAVMRTAWRERTIDSIVVPGVGLLRWTSNRGNGSVDDVRSEA